MHEELLAAIAKLTVAVNGVAAALGQKAPRAAEGGSMKVELTESEAESLRDYLELSFIQYVKDNPDIDSMLWMDNMLSIWRKCGGRNQYADGEEANDEP